MKKNTVRTAEVRKAAKAVRRHLAASLAFLDAGDATRAFGEMESAQHAAYDAKDLIASGDRHVEEQPL